MILNLAILHMVLAFVGLVLVYRNKVSTKSQKGLQSLFTIVLPFIGPVITIIMVFSMKAKPSARSTDVGDSAESHVRKFGTHG